MAAITDNEAFYRSANFPLLKECDMESDVKDEAADICVAAAEKYKDNLEKAAQVTDALYRVLIICYAELCLDVCAGTGD